MPITQNAFMKKMIACFFAIALINIVHAQQHNIFRLKGFITGKSSGKLYLRYYSHDKKNIDSAIIKDGRFLFQGILDEPSQAELSDDRTKMNKEYANYCSDFYLDPTEMMLSLTAGNFNEFQLEGSRTNKEYTVFNRSLQPSLDKIDLLQKKNQQAGSPSVSDLDSLNSCISGVEKIASDFIKKHRRSLVSIKAIQRLSFYNDIKIDSCLALLNKLDAIVKKYPAALKLKESYIASITSAIGQYAKGFSRKDVNGKNISLSSFKGKYILLDFWASWCAPCRELTPQIKALYTKYQAKGLIVIAVSCDSKYEDWRKAISHDGIDSFVNILSFTDADMIFLKNRTNMFEASFKGELRKQFNLMPIPAEILIDKTGRIAGRYGLGENSDVNMLEKELAVLLDKN
jgi:thiol-disulfide isomerase/thioredoxin